MTITQAWYQWPRIDHYGWPDTFGGFPKPDSNIQCPDGTPATAPLAGVITGINSPQHQIDAWGASITVRMDTPLNAIATHYAFLHCQPIPRNLAVGQRVSVGQVLAYSGGALSQGAQKVPLGFAFYNGDVYGWGPSWSKYDGNPLLNPVPFLDALKNGSILLPANNSSGVTLTTLTALSGATQFVPLSNPGPSFQLPKVSLVPNADVKALLQTIDQVFDVVNPFDVTNAQQDTILGATFTDPFSWIEGFGSNLVVDLRGLVLRGLLIALGVFIIWRLTQDFIDVGALTQNARSVAGNAAKAAGSLLA